MKNLFLLALLLPFPVLANDADYTLLIVEHRFEPAELSVPANQRFTLLIENRDATPEEFDSHALNREKRIAGHGSVRLYIGPLDSGRYPFAGELHEETATGVIIVR
jgi:hypothetical protein